MIDKQELIEYAKLKTLNLGQAEKDYFQNIVLFIIYRLYGFELIFKGGTALSKCYGLDRFSEDLDFNASVIFNVDKFKEYLNRFYLDYELEKSDFKDIGLKITLRLKGPLYNGIKHSLCKLFIDISYRENLLLEPVIKKIINLEDLPSFDVLVMSKEEIFIEKIRAILTRNKARDLYDLWYLSKLNLLEIKKELIDSKVDYYDQKFYINNFKKAVLNKENIWITELSGLIKNVPSFKEVSKEVIDFVKNNIKD
ncbi:nucleotidyl transferase AbiEii/AbiGii toxin family protein [archaeon]|jgi:predicted nucleotidyltransferase component of viral defense system|nr:nucleotidyl transferase AbiEii/AbiGii toxin family protein [archaeon]